MTNRQTYLISVLDQLQAAIRHRDAEACGTILENARVNEPQAVDEIVSRLIAAGLNGA